MMRFYDADEGNIYIDGRDIRTFDKKELRRRFGVVFQNDFLFSDTVRNNVDFHRGISDGELEKALKFAQADFIFALRKALKENFSDKTIIMIAQRISSVRHADKILVLDNGKAAGLGSDEELRESCPLYGEILRSQGGCSDE